MERTLEVKPGEVFDQMKVREAHVMSRIAWKLSLAMALLLISATAGPAQVKPTETQMEELSDTMKAFRQYFKGGNKLQRKSITEKLIRLVDKYYKIPGDNIVGEPTFDSEVEGEGLAIWAKGGKVEVYLGEKAFYSPDGKTTSIPWLASTKLHEIIGHGAQAAQDKLKDDDKSHALNEVEAYDLEIKLAETTGLSEVEIEELKKRRQAHYDELNDANKKKIDEGNYSVAFAPPTDSSIGGLSGQANVFVSSTVYADEITTVTVRGPRTLEGYVVATEVEGKRAQSKTDAWGRTVLALPDSATGTKTASTINIRVFDATGKEIARGQTRLQPGAAPDAVDRPSIEKLPSDLRRGDLITIAGSSMGPECEMIIGNQVQETLAASVNEITTYCDTPQLGPQDAWVRNPYGESKSFPTNVYSFNVSAPRTSITRGEQLTATARYQSMRPGTEVRFKNNTPNVVTMDVPGAKAAGNEAVVTVTNANGAIPINLKGLSQGAFAISYEVYPPQKK